MSRRIVLLLASLLCACGGHDVRTLERLDTLTGVTLTYGDTPMIFYRDDSGKAAYARNFINMGPIEVNRMGEYRYYLWLGVWSTQQNFDSSETRDSFDSIVIIADVEPLSLDLAGWTAASIGASEHVYVRPVAASADAYYEVNVDQLRLIAASSEIRIQPTGPNTQTYELWDEQASAKSSLFEFLKKSVY